MNVPCGFANFAIDPLYAQLILNGADLGDADFVPGMIYKTLPIKWPDASEPPHLINLTPILVSAGFLIACAACSYFIVYSFFLIWRWEEPSEVPTEEQKAIDKDTIDKDSFWNEEKKEISSALWNTNCIRLQHLLHIRLTK